MTENEEIVTEATLPGAEASGVALPASRSKKLIKRLGWIALGFFCLLAFTLIKLPREQIQAYIHGSITSALAEQGYSLTAGQTQLSYFLGITYSMKEVKLATPTGNVIRLDQIEVSPSLFPLFVGKVGASYSIQTPGNGKVSGKLAANKKAYATSFKVNSVDLKTSGLLEGLAHLSAAGLVNGSGDLKGDFTNPATTQGDLKLDLTKLIIEQQQIMGFNIPKLSISEGKADVVITQGKAQIRTFTLGKPGNAADDVQATLSGDMTLARQLEASALNLQAHFKLSENVLKSFVLLDTLLSSGKQADGSYGFRITGVLGAPSSEPLQPDTKP